MTEHKKNYAYIILLDEILRDIQNGVYEVGSMLPTQVEFAERYKVSRLTVREALKELMRRGIIESTRGRGTVVKEQPAAIAAVTTGRVSGFSTGGGEGEIHHSRLLELQKIPASKKIASLLSTEIGAALIYVKRLRIVNGEPMMLDVSYFPYDLVKTVDFRGADLENGSLYRLLSDQAHIIFSETREEFRAGLASGEIAKLLGVFEGEPIIISYRFTMVDDELAADPVVGEYSEHYIRTDRGPVVIKSKK